LLADRYLPDFKPARRRDRQAAARANLIQYIDLLVGMICCYLSISFILADEGRFPLQSFPFVEFAKETKGARPMLVDTSVLIDGRIADVADTGDHRKQIESCRSSLLLELQAVADSADKLKRKTAAGAAWKCSASCKTQTLRKWCSTILPSMKTTATRALTRNS